ncbi:DUF1294 domain-containing protein [Paenibacillus sp. NPDC058071]|uniref:DUF1294 domain-containing protein n=1 Tax=Paenibacillus sp. NPDC058071 TaxID=3346326 RepID=UPI0036D88C3E
MVLACYLIAVNAWAFTMMGLDKRYAIKRSRRIPEKRLFAAGIAGGALGGWLGMLLFRHKTKHASFRIGMPLLTLLNIVIVYAVAAYLISGGGDGTFLPIL